MSRNFRCSVPGDSETSSHTRGARQALWSPSTAIIDYGAVATALAGDIEKLGGRVLLDTEVSGIVEVSSGVRLDSEAGSIVAHRVIACAGLQADRVTRMTGHPAQEAMVPFRGSYYLLSPSASDMVRGLIYPVPDPRFPFLGIHLTRRIDGSVLAGPNAVLAFEREGYRRRDVNVGDLRSVLGDPGFRKLARAHWRTGLAEMWRDWDKQAFTRAVRRFVPELTRRDLHSGPVGVRAQAVDPDGSLVDDFRIGSTGNIMHVRNAPSPAATASLAIAKHVVDEAERQFADLG